MMSESCVGLLLALGELLGRLLYSSVIYLLPKILRTLKKTLQFEI
jgi:hypothetical protein